MATNYNFFVRFYLGYPAIGLLKFSTLGFFFIGHLVCVLTVKYVV